MNSAFVPGRPINITNLPGGGASLSGWNPGPSHLDFVTKKDLGEFLTEIRKEPIRSHEEEQKEKEYWGNGQWWMGQEVPDPEANMATFVRPAEPLQPIAHTINIDQPSIEMGGNLHSAIEMYPSSDEESEALLKSSAFKGFPTSKQAKTYFISSEDEESPPSPQKKIEMALPPPPMAQPVQPKPLKVSKDTRRAMNRFKEKLKMQK